MDAPETIPPLLSCNEHSELNQAASPKTGDQSTRTLPDFSLGSPSFESLIFSEEVSQMESWLPDIAADCFQNVRLRYQCTETKLIRMGTRT